MWAKLSMVTGAPQMLRECKDAILFPCAWSQVDGDDLRWPHVDKLMNDD